MDDGLRQHICGSYLLLLAAGVRAKTAAAPLPVYVHAWAAGSLHRNVDGVPGWLAGWTLVRAPVG